MRLLLDTHVVLWWRQDSRHLKRAAKRAIAGASVVYVSAASVWEAVIKSSIGRLTLTDPFERHVDEASFEPLSITFSHAAEVGRLPPLHADPFDRMLIAQARVERLLLVTHDDRIARYEVDTLLT